MRIVIAFLASICGGCGLLADTSGCAPTKLAVAFTTGSLSAVVSFPTPISVRVLDDCGTPFVKGTVAFAYSNGDAPNVASLGNGFWAATAVFSRPGIVSITAIAVDSTGTLKGQAMIMATVAATSGLVASNFTFPPVEAGGAPSTQTITITSSIPGEPFTVDTFFAGIRGSDELTIQPSSGITPANVQLQFKPAVDRAVHEYSGLLIFDGTILTPPFPLIVAPPETPALVVNTPPLLFTYIGETDAQTQNISIGNRSGIALHFTAAAATSSGGSWLTVTPPEADVTLRQPVTISITADPSRLAEGTYSGKIVIVEQTDGDTDEVPVTMTVTTDKPSILLSQTGLSFSAVENGRTEPSQTVRILNNGKGNLNWSVKTRVLGTDISWLSATPIGGQSLAGSTDNPEIAISADATGLGAGQYYGLVEISDPRADNGPQYLTVVLRVAPNDGRPAYFVRPSGVVFTGVSGADIGPPQRVRVYDLSGADVTFSSGSAISKGDDPNWLQYDPSAFPAALHAPDPDGAVSIDVFAAPRNLAPGVHRAKITLQFPDTSTRDISVLFQVGALSATEQQRKVSSQGVVSCVPTRVDMQYTSSAGSVAVAGWPSSLLVHALDDCKQPWTSGSLDVSFSTGEPTVSLQYVGDGTWGTTWIPRHGNDASVQLSFHASDPSRGIDSRSPLPVEIPKTESDPPVLNAIVEAGSSGSSVTLAPGSLMSVIGERLSRNDAVAIPPPYAQLIGETALAIRGELVPLSALTAVSMAGEAPFDLPVNTTLQMVATRGATVSTPISITIAAAQPSVLGVYHTDATGVAVDTNYPAHPGETIVIECAGLGAVTPPVVAGTVAPDGTSTVRPVTVQIGGEEAIVWSSGLKAGAVGIYQVRTKVPDDATPSNSATIQVSVGERVGEIRTISIAP